LRPFSNFHPISIPFDGPFHSLQLPLFLLFLFLCCSRSRSRLCWYVLGAKGCATLQRFPVAAVVVVVQ
jgi:hypothetical protein